MNMQKKLTGIAHARHPSENSTQYDFRLSAYTIVCDTEVVQFSGVVYIPAVYD